jgi:hypothetical protein
MNYTHFFFLLQLLVGGLAASMNYLSSKNTPLFSIALFGLSLIYAANGHGGPILSLLPHDLAHSLHCGTMLHRMVNIMGCACLLSSNYYAHRLSCNHGVDGESCGHNHDHSHSHSHGHSHSHDHSHSSFSCDHDNHDDCNSHDHSHDHHH